jgi:transcriptional regulator with XRE-family HTH domain
MPPTTIDPRVAAAQLFDDHDEDWVGRFAEEVERRRGGRGLRRVMRLWQLSRTELGELFGISRQAVSKWLDSGVPPERAARVAEIEAVTDLLERYLKRDRIPAVVRRPAPRLGGTSLLDMVATGRSAEALALTREMFLFGDLHR